MIIRLIIAVAVGVSLGIAVQLWFGFSSVGGGLVAAGVVLAGLMTMTEA